MPEIVQNPDVIIIGAGTAGLSAAKALRNAGKAVLVLEAADHTGGRCITDTKSFSVPFDKGGSWLHSAVANPLSKIANDNGYALHKKPWNWQKVVIEGTHLTQQQVAEYADYMKAMWKRIIEAGSTEKFPSIEAVLPESPWKDTAKLYVAQMLGGDYDVTSPQDVASFLEADGDWLIAGGLGNFVRDIHSNVEVVLSCPVSNIDYSGSRVRVTTPRGIAVADYVILTVSVGVLAAEKIEFYPPLPNRKLNAIGNLPNGLLNKIGIEFDQAWKETFEGYSADYHAGAEQYCHLEFGFYDSGLATGFVAGRFAQELEAEGQGAATEFCLQALREMFGNDVFKYVLKTGETKWNNNDKTFGAYSYALPGRADARKELGETLDEKLLFAGEATMPSAFATVHGAYQSGIEAASQLLVKQGSISRTN